MKKEPTIKKTLEKLWNLECGLYEIKGEVDDMSLVSKLNFKNQLDFAANSIGNTRDELKKSITSDMLK